MTTRRSVVPSIAAILLGILLAGSAALFSSCATGPGASGAGDWEIVISGVREETVDAAYFVEAQKHASHYREITLERKGERVLFKGMPLWYLAAMADGEDAKHPFLFDSALWEKGYDITVTGRDGYTVTFNTAEYDPDALYLSDNEAGVTTTPNIVGTVPGTLWVRDVVSIELGLGADTSQSEVFTLEIVVNGEKKSFTLEDLESSVYYLEGKGSFTTSAGTTYTNAYGGVELYPFLSSFVQLGKDSTITFAAMDGYEMSFSAGDFVDRADGVWILAFRMDGEYLPLDPGYIRTVKVGPSIPNIQGHSSVRMVKRIAIMGEPYREFSLGIEGRISAVLDRQTVQSGVSCHPRTVQYLNRKTNEVLSYTGIPLYLLLAYADDPQYMPHKQMDRSILSYDAAAAEKGYTVEVVAADGFTVKLDSRQLHDNEDVILAMFQGDAELPADAWPLILVWDKDAKLVPDGIKAVRQVAKIILRF